MNFVASRHSNYVRTIVGSIATGMLSADDFIFTLEKDLAKKMKGPIEVAVFTMQGGQAREQVDYPQTTITVFGNEIEKLEIYNLCEFPCEHYKDVIYVAEHKPKNLKSYEKKEVEFNYELQTPKYFPMPNDVSKIFRYEQENLKGKHEFIISKGYGIEGYYQVKPKS